MKKSWIILLMLSLILVIAGCSKDATTTQDSSKNDEPVVVQNESERNEIKKEAQNLFDQLINLEAKKSEKEALAVIDKIAVNPKEYKKSLKENKITLQTGRYIRANAAHRDDEVKKLSNGNYIYSSFTTIEMQESKDKEPISDSFVLEMEITKKDSSWKVVKLQVEPSGE